MKRAVRATGTAEALVSPEAALSGVRLPLRFLRHFWFMLLDKA
jgi:hypothetical protein